jgi:hypothetical protein
MALATTTPIRSAKAQAVKNFRNIKMRSELKLFQRHLKFLSTTNYFRKNILLIINPSHTTKLYINTVNFLKTN